MKLVWLAVFSLFFLCSGLNGAPWVGYPFLVTTPFIGGGSKHGPASSSFLMILADHENPGIRPNSWFRRLLSDLTGVCSDSDQYNVPCEEWVNGNTYLILRGLDLKSFPEQAHFMLVTVAPKSLLDFCANIPPNEAPCIAENYRNVPRGRGRRLITSEIYAVYPNHGPLNPFSFSLDAGLAKQSNLVVFEGAPVESLGPKANIRINFRPIRDNPPPVDSEETIGRFLQFGPEVDEIEMSIDYRGQPLVIGTAVRCDLPDCGLSFSTTQPTVPSRDLTM